MSLAMIPSAPDEDPVATALGAPRRRRRLRAGRPGDMDQRHGVPSQRPLEGFQEARLPRTEAKCPSLILMPDGTLCPLLPNMSRRIEDSMDDFICKVNLKSMSLLWSGRLHGYRFTEPCHLAFRFLQEDLSSRLRQERVIQHLRGR